MKTNSLGTTLGAAVLYTVQLIVTGLFFIFGWILNGIVPIQSLNIPLSGLILPLLFSIISLVFSVSLIHRFIKKSDVGILSLMSINYISIGPLMTYVVFDTLRFAQNSEQSLLSLQFAQILGVLALAYFLVVPTLNILGTFKKTSPPF